MLLLLLELVVSEYNLKLYKVSQMDIYEAFRRLPVEERNAIVERPNDNFAVRLAINEDRTIWSQRGMDLEELESTTIPAVVANRRWGRFAQTPGLYNPGLVREFYAAMVPEAFHEYGIVTMRGRAVEISPSRINRFLGTRNFGDLRINHGMPRHDFFENNYDSRVAASLRREGTPGWAPHVQDLRHSELSPDLALWGIFLKHNLLASRYRTTMMNGDGHILFAIQHGIDIDVGMVIWWQLIDAGRQTGILPFPSLITHFCGRAGIPDATNDDELELPMGNINRKTYNAFCRPIGLPFLPTGRPPRNRQRNQLQAANVQQQEQVDEPMHEPMQEHMEEPHADAAPPPFEGQPMFQQPIDQQQWMQQMMALTRANADSITSLTQEFSSFRLQYQADHEQYQTDRAHYGGRLDAIYNIVGGPHQGRVYNRRTRGDDAGPSSQHPGSSSMHPGDNF